ncbi:MAG: hypothetical protein ACQERC_06605 [Bacteroidota bacterium]
MSFDKQLFHKELVKAVNWIQESDDFQKFRAWCMAEFGHRYPTVLHKVFQ